VQEETSPLIKGAERSCLVDAVARQFNYLSRWLLRVLAGFDLDNTPLEYSQEQSPWNYSSLLAICSFALVVTCGPISVYHQKIFAKEDFCCYCMTWINETKKETCSPLDGASSWTILLETVVVREKRDDNDTRNSTLPRSTRDFPPQRELKGRTEIELIAIYYTHC